MSHVALVPSLGALHAFERAAAHLSFRKAAEDLALTPSAISHQIRGLESSFGVRLFARAGRGVVLTPPGRRYYLRVRDALSVLSDAGAELQAGQSDMQGWVHVSSLPFFTRTVLIPSLAAFRAEHPGLSLSIEATHLYADFDDPAVDVSIRFGPVNTRGVRLERLIGIGARPYCAPSLAARLREPADLLRMPLIHQRSRPTGWADWLDDVGLRRADMPGDLSFDSVPSALDAAEAGLGVVLAIEPLVSAWPGCGHSLVAPFAHVADHGLAYYLAFRPEQSESAKVVAFRAWLSSALARFRVS